MVLLACPARAESRDYVRLHVVAADDTAPAQALKLEVRDAVLARARELLRDVGDAEAAWRVVNDHVDELEAAARRVAGDARCEVGVFPFPERVYGGTRVPAGDYRPARGDRRGAGAQLVVRAVPVAVLSGGMGGGRRRALLLRVAVAPSAVRG